MNRARKTNRGLPKRVYLKHGAWRFFAKEKMIDPVDGREKRWIHLAYDYQGEAAMYDALAKLLGSKQNEEGSMPSVCAEFKLKKLKKYGEETRDTYARYLDKIAEDFEEYQAAQVTTKDWGDFLRNHFSDKANTAQKYTALARKLFKFVIGELGLRRDNPIDQFDLSDYETERRAILPTHEQVRQIREAGMFSKPRQGTGKVLPNPSGPMFQCLIDMTYLCWGRAIDVRTLKESQIVDGWIRLTPSKTAKSSGKSVDIMITPQIQAVIDRARQIKKAYKKRGANGSLHDIVTPYLFPSQKGTPYTKSGLFSMWDRARDRLGIDKDSPPELRIQFKDLRALGATDAARANVDKKKIQDRLVHTTSKTTDIYIKDVIPVQSEIDMVLPWGSV